METQSNGKNKGILFQCNPREEVLGAKGEVGIDGVEGIDWGKEAGKGRCSWDINYPKPGESPRG